MSDFTPIIFPDLFAPDDNPNSLTQISQRIATRDENHRRIQAEIDAGMEQFKELRTKELSPAVESAKIDKQDHYTLSKMREGVRNAVLAEVKDVRAEAHQNASEALDSDEKAITAEWEKLDALHQMTGGESGLIGFLSMQNPAAADQRARYAAAVDPMGAVEMLHMMKLAIAQKNIPLAAALLSKIDAMPKEQRPFKRGELATPLAGALWQRLSDAHTVARLTVQNTQRRRTEIRTGQSNPHENLKYGLRKQTNIAAVDRIRKGLDDAQARADAAKNPVVSQ
jgi:hypothetical protein